MVTQPHHLSVTNIVVLRAGKLLLDGVSMDLPLRGTHVILGPNGAGKSTLLRALHGMERLKSGSIVWPDGPEGAMQAAYQRAYVFQTPIVLRRTVLGNLMYPLLLKRLQKKEAEDKARELAGRFGLSTLLNARAERLSGGEKQVLALARALTVDPDVLFLDEPTTNLDGQTTRLIEATVHAFSQSGRTVFLATHDLGQARRLAGHIYFLHRGHLLEEAPAKLFFEGPQTEAARNYLAGDIVE
ncbi:MAG: ATP-binding cassette domain-containing protein [Pseudomonadota bacterium]